MTTSNHILAGSIIALAVKQPLLVIPLAFTSHFVLDALPHYGYDGSGYAEAAKYKMTYVMEFLGLVGLVLLVLSGAFTQPIVLVGAFFAVLPDFEWPYRYFFFERKGLEPPKTFLTNFHLWIQWCERNWGIVPEVFFFILLYPILLKLVNS